ncbi:MAG TPA: NUDIX domain-containing protein [Streptosporangiaceae bacterium]|nr:NUDIX domain-containing protein [Streptosporangiaceae bacterium]
MRWPRRRQRDQGADRERVHRPPGRRRPLAHRLVWHFRLDCWPPAGGHVEPGETAAKAAVSEAREETGLDVRLLHGPAIPVPAGFTHPPRDCPIVGAGSGGTYRRGTASRPCFSPPRPWIWW